MEEKLRFQYVMSYKAYRRIMVFTRVCITVLLAGGAATLALLNLILGILVPVSIAFLGAIAIIASFNKEETYMVFDDRVVIKSGQKRIAVPMENIKSVSYRRAVYERDLATGTVKIRAVKPGKKSVGTYKLKHILDAKPVVEFLSGNHGEERK